MSDTHHNITPEKAWKRVFLDALADCPNVSKAARKADICRRHAYQARDSDPVFAGAWNDALESSLDDVEEALTRRAKVDDTTAAIFMLKAHRPEKYREKVATEHSGKIEIVIVHEHQNTDQPTYPASGAGEPEIEFK